MVVCWFSSCVDARVFFLTVRKRIKVLGMCAGRGTTGMILSNVVCILIDVRGVVRRVVWW